MKKNIYPGKFIVFEGLDGSGQSTESEFLRDFLIEKNHKVLMTKEPTIISEAGKKIKQVLEEKEKISPLELQKLFVEDRKLHLDNIIIPNLKDGKIVTSGGRVMAMTSYGESHSKALKKSYQSIEKLHFDKMYYRKDIGFDL